MAKIASCQNLVNPKHVYKASSFLRGPNLSPFRSKEDGPRTATTSYSSRGSDDQIRRRFRRLRGLASKPIAPQDPAAMQCAEDQTLGKAQKGGPAAEMHPAAIENVQAGEVFGDSVTEVVRDEGDWASRLVVDSAGIVTEFVGDEVVGQYTEPETVQLRTPAAVLTLDPITIAEALESTAFSVGDKPVDRIDATAIQAAEMRAIGSSNVLGIISVKKFL
ncbi:hypothetical protein Nepgr_029799 [Nepenthes gracilis]|uniref:SMP domain-containing protein n=1 Tax=Nepenthes gracilis TaxID=150966 RepID=A0AAD3TEZ5_NEPGR|nr:hypothetical protein Nepgr_029799 [Nepenthes gracilis]